MGRLTLKVYRLLGASGLDQVGEDGTELLHAGTQILGLAPGDCATYLRQACTCGLTTPRLRNVQRVRTEN